MSEIKILLNGEEKILKNQISLSDLIKEFDLDVKKIAIEKDLEIVNPQDFSTTLLTNGNRVEIVHFIGGG